MRRLRMVLPHSGVSGLAVLLEEEAPRTCEVIRDALPIEGPFFHAKWENNAVYTLVAPFARDNPGPENQTVFPIPGDLLYIPIPPGNPIPPEGNERHRETGTIDLAFFYGRDNYLLGPHGHMPGNRFATMDDEDLPGLHAACTRLWREGHAYERLRLEAA